jgi:membrane protein
LGSTIWNERRPAVLARIARFFGELSLVKLAEYSRPIAWALRCLRILFYIFDEFLRDNCLQRAASLAYTTLLSLVPLMAISLAVLSRFTFSQETVHDFLMEHLLPTASFQQVIMENIQKFARNTAALSIFGGLFLAVTAVALLNTVEGSFNAIWRVTERRNFLSRFTAFWSIITFSPVLLGASMVLTSRFYRVGVVGTLLRHEFIRSTIHYVLPFFFVFLLIFLAYRLLPHTKVRVWPALMGALIATFLFSYARWGFGVYVGKYANFEKIYGILGTLPAFLIWIYVSWVIVLFGAEVTYTFQYHRLRPEDDTLPPDDPMYNPYYGIRVALALSDAFHEGRGPVFAVDLAKSLNVRYELVRSILSRFRDVNIAASVDEAGEKFLAARDPGQVRVKEVVEALQQGNLMTPPLAVDVERNVIEDVFEKARGAMDDVLGRITVKEVWERTGHFRHRPENSSE